MKKMGTIGWIALVLVIVGALNWGLVGILQFNLVDALLGSVEILPRIVYAVVGIAALYMIIAALMEKPKK